MTELKLTPSYDFLQPQNNRSSSYRWMRWVLIAVGACTVGPITFLFVALWVAFSFLPVKAFRMPSSSMCPTLCENERFFVRVDNYGRRTPQRGDVIMFQLKDQPLPYAKRIIGVEGDVVAPGGNAILVNNRALAIPKVCGRPPSRGSEPGAMPPFEPVTVPEDSYFVVGDNLSNSYDSRYFGVITRDQIRGQMLFIYWSSGSGRIGCAIR